MNSLQDRIAIVTGSDSGIGQATAQELARAGADVAVTFHRDRDGADETRRRIEALGRRAVVLQADVRASRAIDALFETVRQRLGVPSILVNNAGVDAQGTEVAELSDEGWDAVLKTNLYGPFYASRAFARLRRGAGGGGRIVNISSVHERNPRPGGAAYDASKGGLRNLMRTLALELAPLRINVNNIAPGMVLTPMNPAAIDDPAVMQRQTSHIPWRRAAEPVEIARLVRYLVSDDADYVTGQTFTIDGGLSLVIGQRA